MQVNGRAGAPACVSCLVGLGSFPGFDTDSESQVIYSGSTVLGTLPGQD